MRPRLMIMVLALSQTAVLPAQKSAVPHVGQATVQIVAVDGFGRDLGEAKIDSFRDEDHGHQLAGRFRENRGQNIPYGTYDLKLHRTGFFSTERKIYVFKPDVWVVVALEVGEELPAFPAPSWTLSGTVKNFNLAEEPIYVRLVGLYSNYRIEDRLDVSGQSGSFTLAGRNPRGRFLLITVGRTHILDIREVEIPCMDPIVIDLEIAKNKQAEEH
jgi:hypothetical protein